MNPPAAPAGGGFANAQATWNERYAAAAGPLFGAGPNTWLAERAGLIPPGGPVLCVADGDGRNSVWLAQRGHRVAGFDVADVAVAQAHARAAAAGVAVEFAVAGVEDYAWPVGSCSAVVAVFVQFAPPPLRAWMFQRMADALAPGGVLLLLGYSPKQLQYRTGGPPREDHLYTPALLREAFASLRIDELSEFEADLAEGRQHLGRSALVGLVGVRS